MAAKHNFRLLFQIIAIPLIVSFTGFASETKPNPASQAKTTERGKAAVQKIIFEEQKIEGKIRRPQMVLIKADQRPTFTPMLMQSAGKTDNITATINPAVIENAIYQGAFQFNGTQIINYLP